MIENLRSDNMYVTTEMVSYYKNDFEEVTVIGHYGVSSSDALTSALAVLPNGFRPEDTLLVPVTLILSVNSSAAAHMQILRDGTMTVLTSAISAIGLTGIIFNFGFIAAPPLEPLEEALSKLGAITSVTINAPITDAAASSEAIGKITMDAQALIGADSDYRVIFVPMGNVVPAGAKTGTINGKFIVINNQDLSDSGESEVSIITVISIASSASWELAKINVTAVNIGNISLIDDPVSALTAAIIAVQNAAAAVIDYNYIVSFIPRDNDPLLPLSQSTGYLFGNFTVTSLNGTDIATGPLVQISITSTYVGANPAEDELAGINLEPITIMVPLDDPAALTLANTETEMIADQLISPGFSVTFVPAKIVPTGLTAGVLYGKFTVTYLLDGSTATDAVDRMIVVNSTMPSTGSIAAASFLSGSIMGNDLETIFGNGGAAAAFINGLTPGTENVVTTPLDLGAFNNQLINLPSGLEVPLGALLQIGAANNYAKAIIDGESYAYSGAVSSEGGIAVGLSPEAPDMAVLDFLTLIGGPNEILSKLQIVIGAIIGAVNWNQKEFMDTGAAMSNTADLLNLNQQQGYNVARDKSDIVSPLIGDLVNQITDMAYPISDAVTALLAPVADVIKTSLTSFATSIGVLAIGGITVSGIDSVRVESFIDLQTALAPLLSNEIKLVGDTITLSLPEGRISKDMRLFNDLPPNSPILGSEVITSILNQIDEVFAGLRGEIGLILPYLINSIIINISGNVTLSGRMPILGPDIDGTITISYNGTLSDLIADPSKLQVTVSGTGLNVVQPAIDVLISGLYPALSPALSTVQTELLPTVEAVVDTAMEVMKETVFTPLHAFLAPIGALFNIMVNVQQEPVPGQFMEIPLQFSLLSDTAVINLGKVTAGPNYYTVGTIFHQ